MRWLGGGSHASEQFVEAQSHASAAVWRYAACPTLRYAFAARRGQHVVCRGKLRVLGGLGAVARGLSEEAPGGGMRCPRSARCGWPGCNDGIELVDLLSVSVA